MKPFDFDPTFMLSIVKDKFYSVPRYQRSYAWTTDMVKDFWSDMGNAIQDKREHFLGNIVISLESEDGTQSIVDGQQRIVTTTLLIAALRDEFTNSKETKAAAALDVVLQQYDTKNYEDRPRVRLNPDDNLFYSDRILKSGSACHATRPSHSAIADAYNYFRAKLGEVIANQPDTWKVEFAKYVRFLEEQARVVLVTAPTDADAFAVFETLNDRGADLTISDLLKNLLFSRSKTELDTVQQLWIETRTIIEELMPRTNMMMFLRHQWSSRYGATRERDLYRQIKGELTTKEKAIAYAKSLRSDAILYRAILSPTDDFWKTYSPTSKAGLASLDRLNLEQLRPMLIALLQHFAPKEAEAASKFVLNWVVRGLIGGVLGAGKAETYFCNAALEIRSGKIKNATQLQAELKELIPSDAVFQEEFARYRTTNNAFARYLLLSIERSLTGEKEPELVPNENVEEVNLEHVLPQRGKPVDWPSFTAEQIPLFAYRLGNMTLLQKGPNGKIGNKPFATKKAILQQSKFKLNGQFGQAADWRQPEIEQRQVALAQVAPKVWPLA